MLAAKKSEVAPALLQGLVQTATASASKQGLAKLLEQLSSSSNGQLSSQQDQALATVLESLSRRQLTLTEVATPKVIEQLQTVFQMARQSTKDTSAAEAERIAAMRLLGHDPAQVPADVEALAELLSVHHSPALQNTALQTLGRLSSTAVATTLTKRWPQLTPTLQTQVMDLLLSRKAWLTVLLDSAEKKNFPISQIDASRRQRLLQYPDENIHKRVTALLQGTADPDRQKVMDAFRPALQLTGNAARGQTVFRQRCASCHRLGNIGQAVGPDLAALSGKSPAFFLQEIFAPSTNLDSRYVAYLAETKAGQVFTGLLAEETATSVTLKDTDGKQQVLLRSDLETFQSTGRSFMPEGLEKDLQLQQLADLLAFLTSHKPAARVFPGNRPEIIVPVKDVLTLLATNAEIYGEQICFEASLRNIGYWHGLADHVTWTVRLKQEGTYDVYLEWACAPESAGNRYSLDGEQPLLQGQVASTGGWDKYQQQKIGTITLSASDHRLTLRPTGGTLRQALLDLRGLYLVPAGRKWKGPDAR
jgi:putative heme-binding domain-containing protein